MKTKAALAVEAAQPLVIEELDLDGPKEGEVLIVPKGVEHRPHTNGEVVFNLLFEPKTILHTGDVETDMTVKELDWI